MKKNVWVVIGLFGVSALSSERRSLPESLAGYGDDMIVRKPLAKTVIQNDNDDAKIEQDDPVAITVSGITHSSKPSDHQELLKMRVFYDKFSADNGSRVTKSLGDPDPEKNDIARFYADLERFRTMMKRREYRTTEEESRVISDMSEILVNYLAGNDIAKDSKGGKRSVFCRCCPKRK